MRLATPADCRPHGLLGRAAVSGQRGRSHTVLLPHDESRGRDVLLPSRQRAVATTRAPTLRFKARDCCEKITTTARSATVRGLGTDFSVPPATLTATVSDPVYVFPSMVASLTLPPQARAPPAAGPPLFILHCAFLT